MSGELGVQIPMMTIKFLSHACGGERQHIFNHWRRSFLSHACGGELELCLTRHVVAFLSHACGGEPFE